MKCLVISDLHGNIYALEAVLSDAGPVDLVLALGDYSGFGLHANEVVDRLRHLPNLVPIKGNWLASAQRHLYRDRRDPSRRRKHGLEADKIASMGVAALARETESFIRSLPERVRLNLEGVETLLVHGSVLHPVKGHLEPGLDAKVLGRNARASQARLVLHGDTHVQGSFEVEGVTLVNPGSLGWPSDGDWRSAYALITFRNGDFRVEFRRAEYDAERASRELHEAGLPNAGNLLQGVSIWSGL